MSVKPDDSKDEEGTHGPEVTVVETNRFGFILGNGETDRDGPCPELVRHRESKWLSLMTQWEQVMEKKSNKVKGQCQKGIPASVRAKGWPLLCGAKDRKEKNDKLYERLVKAPDHQGWTDIIKRDTDRQFPFHEMFQSKDGHGQKDLLEVLKAYTQYRPDEGYCQAQGPVAAVLLMNMPAEEAFWCLVQISDLYLPGYYSPLLEGVLFDAAFLSSIFKKLCPAAHKHLQNQGVEPLMFATDWLMCLYSRHLPFDTLLRVWDLFFCYGVRVLFQVAVVLVRRCLGEGRLRKECDGQMETLERLRGVKQRVQHEQADAFIHEVCSVSLSLADLQKQTEKELERWKKERPNSTFDPRGRCHGYRMVWERAQDKPKEQEKKERPKGSLTLPLTRSHSSLSPLVLRKKWRKRSSKTDTEEWDAGGRNFSRSVMEESDDEEVRRRSVCGIIGEQRAKRDRLADELCSHKDHNTHPKISVVVSSSIDCDVFEKEHTETSLNQEKDHLETTRGDEKERTAGCVVEESIQTHHHIQDTNQDAQSTETQGHQDEQNIEKDKNQDDQNTEAPTNQNEQNTDKQTCQDEQTVETERILEPCEESTSQEEDIQTEHCKQEEETEDRLPNTIMTLENEENIPEKEVQIHVVQEEERSQTSGDQHEEQEHSERQKEDLFINTAIEEDEETRLIGENHTDADKEEGIQQEFDLLPEETTEISDPSNMCEEKDDERQDTSLDESDSPSHSGKETLQPPEIVLTSFSLKTEREIETEHPDGPTDPEQQSQSSDQEHSDVDTTVTSRELEPCPIDSTVEDAEGSGNPEQSEVDSADDTNILEPQEEGAASTHSVGTCDKEISEVNKSENIVCCEINTDESSNLTNNVEDDTCRSVHAESIEMHAAPGSENLECNTTDITADSGKLESNSLEIAAGSGNPESNSVPVTSESGNPEQSDVDGNLENNDVHVTTESGNLECNITDVTTETEKTESDGMDVAVGSDNSKNNIIGSPVENPQCNDVQVTTGSGNTENNMVDSAIGSGNPDHKVHVTTESDNSETNREHVTTGSDNPECNDVPSTSESGNPENNIVDSAVGSGNPDYKEDHITTRSENSETSKEHVSAGSGNPECKTEDCAAESGNPHNNECAIPGNSQGLESPSSISTSKSPNPNVPPAHLRSSRVSYPTILSEDTFKEPQQQEHTHSEQTTPSPTQDTEAQPNSPTKSGPPKRLGLFRRLRGETNKTPVPKILIQDFSEKEERLTAKERRRRKREKERKEREEKDRKKREKEMEKDKAKERKKPQTRGKSFQVLSRKGANNAVTPGNSDSQTSHARRNSAPFSDGYF
ncbi:probable WRKY transcription factor protein 1 [Sinocyclocheilus rhinocerous]|uniref:probable WRKY transcription factor protein 1 n=1 Tax=Sinocyclocheilus rhinocerous TaxID=307959 RepID=UPI0007B87226|nr:PREDICTED: probable WRKY transcription factor protein 1 [Sinocyclocheilus rhinocerous]